MALVNEFERKLDEIWDRRTTNLRSLIAKRQGRPAEFSVSFRSKRIKELQDLATLVLIRQGAAEKLRQVTAYTRQHHVNGDNGLMPWTRKISGPVVYSFWKGNSCLYVGKAINFSERMDQYIQHFSECVKRGIRIKALRIKTPGALGKAECLANHLYQPKNNRKKPSREKWGKECPICAIHDQIREDLLSLMRLR